MTLSLGVEPERARGVLLGAAVGDALGWPQEDRNNILGGARARDVPPKPEFRAWRRNAGTQFARYEDIVNKGEYSDDTQLLLAVARACEHGDTWLQWLTGIEVPTWPLYQRGGGRAVLSASRAWQEGRPPWSLGNGRHAERSDAYFRAGANGVAMRIAPHALVSSDRHAAELLRRIIADGISTHGHARALMGGVVHGLAIRYALAHRGTLGYGDLIYAILDDETWRDESLLVDVTPTEWIDRFRQVNGQYPTTTWRETVEEMEGLLHLAVSALSTGAMANDERVLGAMGCFDKKQNGSGTVTAAATLYVSARSAARPMSGLLRTAYLQQADADTLASMTASLLSAVHGTSWMGDLATRVQDSQYITDLALRLTHPRNMLPPSEVEHRRPDATVGKYLGSLRVELFDRDSNIDYFHLPDGRPIQVVHRETLHTKANATVERLVARSLDGQTFFFDRVHRSRPAEESSQSELDNEVRSGSPGDPSGTHPHTDANRDLRSPAAAITGLHLRVHDLDDSAFFYGHMLGLPWRRASKRTVQVGALMFLHQADANEVIGGTSQIMVTLRVPSLDAIASRLTEAKYPYGDARNEEREIFLRDLDGYPVQILQT